MQVVGVTKKWNCRVMEEKLQLSITPTLQNSDLH